VTALTFEVQHRVATQVAAAWRRRGIRSYSFDDMYQDAIVAMHMAVDGYDPSKGSLEGFLYSCAVKRLSGTITRALSPVSTRSNDEVRMLRETRATPELDASVPHEPEAAFEHVINMRAIRARMNAIAAREPEGEAALAVALGLCDVRDIAKDGEHARLLYRVVRKVKNRLLGDQRLYKMAREAHA